MRSIYLIPAGAGIGALCGLMFGLDYALAGAAVGLAAGGGFYAGLRGAAKRQSPDR